MLSRPTHPRPDFKFGWRHGVLAWLVLFVGFAPPPDLSRSAGVWSSALYDPAGRDGSSEEDSAPTEEGVFLKGIDLLHARSRHSHRPATRRAWGHAGALLALERAQARVNNPQRGDARWRTRGHFLEEVNDLAPWTQSFLF